MKKVFAGIVYFAILPMAGISQKSKIISSLSERNIPISSFSKLTIDGNLHLTLVESDEPSIQIKGNPRFINAFKIYQRGDALLVRSLYVDERMDNQVIINVRNLEKLVVEGQSVIVTKGLLQSENLTVLINAECLVTIRNQGILKVTASKDFDLENVK